MAATQDVRCFQHCDRSKNILCFTVPAHCPVCSADVTKTAMRIPPYILDSPFTPASLTQCSVLVKPTCGDFLRDFTNSSNLHIALSNSLGVVYEFDERGVVVGGDDWNSCLAVKLHHVDLDNTEERQQWDEALQMFVQQPGWSPADYEEREHNCYDFVLGFLRSYGVERDYPCVKNRSQFCGDMIVPVTAKAGRYISLYRNIERDGCVVQDTAA